MRYGTKIVAISILIALAATGGALAVGYDRYDAEAPPNGQIRANGVAQTDFCSALKKATFVEKAPAALDEVAAFIKDILAQFGLTGNKGR